MKKILILSLIFCTGISAQDYEAGKKLFKNNCASCHHMEKKAVGPPLKNVVKNLCPDLQNTSLPVYGFYKKKRIKRFIT